MSSLPKTSRAAWPLSSKTNDAAFFGPLATGLSSLAVLSILAGCSSMAGIGGTSEYACKAPPGVRCDSVSGTYENAIQNNLPSQRLGRHASSSPAKLGDAVGRTGSLRRTGLSTGRQSEESSEMRPLRSQPRVLSLWIKAYEDSDRDLVGEQRIYVQVDDGRWLVDHYQRAVRSAFAPVKAPTRPAEKEMPPQSIPSETVAAQARSLPQRLGGAGLMQAPIPMDAGEGK